MYGDLRQFLAERTDVDAVLIATGDRWHALASTLAMRAGKDVYCEKPACLTHGAGADGRGDRPAVWPGLSNRRPAAERAESRVCHRNGPLRPAWARFIPFTPTVAGATGCVATGCRRNRNRPRMKLDWDIWLGPCPWRPYNSGYVNGGGWYHYYDFATDVAMWGAHTVAQALAGLDMDNVSFIEFEYAGPDATMVTRLSNGVKLVLYPSRRLGLGTVQVLAWRLWRAVRWSRRLGGGCRRLFRTRCFIAGAVARIQEGAGGLHGPDPTAIEPRAGFPGLHPVAPAHGGESGSHVSVHEHLPGCRHLRATKAKPEVRPAQG